MPDSQRIESFDRVAHLYDETRGQGERNRAEASALFAFLAPLGDAPLVLEVGAGTGRIAIPLAELGARVVGLDVSRKMLAVLRAKSAAVEAVQAEAARLPFRVRCFDAAVSVHILHLVPDAEAMIRATIAAVRPGGVILEGQTSHEHVLADPRQLLREVTGSLGIAHRTAGDRQRRAGELLVRLLTEAGAKPERSVVARWVERTTGKEYLEEVRQRLRSTMWDIPDELLPAVVAGVEERLRQAWGGLDVPVETTAVFTVTRGGCRRNRADGPGGSGSGHPPLPYGHGS